MPASSGDECPEVLRQAFLEMLGHTLVCIRNHSSEAQFCQALAEHVHNVPELLASFRPYSLRYYWEVERPSFLRKLEKIGRLPMWRFNEPWKVVEGEYQRLCGQPIDG